MGEVSPMLYKALLGVSSHHIFSHHLYSSSPSSYPAGKITNFNSPLDGLYCRPLNIASEKVADSVAVSPFSLWFRSAMAAAAAWSRSRGVAGVRATTGLFSIFTLLCLVCLSSSLMHKDQLVNTLMKNLSVSRTCSHSYESPQPLWVITKTNYCWNVLICLIIFIWSCVCYISCWRAVVILTCH